MNNVDRAYRVSGLDPNTRLYEPGALIIEEDSPDDGCIYILLQGTLGVYRGGRQIGQMSGSGYLFGEIATILNSRRTATIQAMTPCKVAVYTGGLKRIVQQFPSITMKIVIALAERVRELTDAATDQQLRIDHTQAELLLQTVLGSRAIEPH